MSETATPAPLAPSTFATSHLTYRVSDDLGPESVIVDVDACLHSDPRWAAEFHGGDDLGNFDVSVRLVAPGYATCEEAAF